MLKITSELILQALSFGKVVGKVFIIWFKFKQRWLVMDLNTFELDMDLISKYVQLHKSSTLRMMHVHTLF